MFKLESQLANIKRNFALVVHHNHGNEFRVLEPLSRAAEFIRGEPSAPEHVADWLLDEQAVGGGDADLDEGEEACAAEAADFGPPQRPEGGSVGEAGSVALASFSSAGHDALWIEPAQFHASVRKAVGFVDAYIGERMRDHDRSSGAHTRAAIATAKAAHATATSIRGVLQRSRVQ